MNKSKFLKKSLAMLLAVMMIVAMIPLSASAAATPVISSVTVNGAEATLSGTTYTAEISNTATVKAEVVLLNGSGSVYHDGEGSLTATNGVYTVAFTSDEISAKAAEIAVFDADDNLAATYVIKFTVGAKDTDTSVKSVTIDGQYGATVYNGSEIVITVPYGTTTSTAMNANIVLNSKKSFVDSNSANSSATFTVSITGAYDDSHTGNAKTFTVTAESGATREYTIKAVVADAFTGFSVAGERKEAKIDVDNKEITVYMPYGTNATTAATPAYKFVPTYTTGYNSVTVKATKTDATLATWKSGTEYNLASYATLTSGATINSKTVTLVLSYTNGATENWKLKFDVPTANPVAEISSLKIGNFVGEISGKNITIKVPANVRSAATDIVLGLSTGSKVSIVGNSLAAVTASGDIATLSSTAGWLADGKNNFTLRVTAGTTDDDGNTDVQDYNLTITTADAETAKLTEMILEDKNGNQYTASIDQTSGKVLFNLPYSVQQASDVKGWKLYWSITSGSTIQSNSTDLAISGAALAGTETYIPAGSSGYNGTAAASKGAQSIVVATSEHNSKTYTVYFKNVAASTAATLTDVSITTVSDTDNITDTNTYKLNGSRDFSVTIPYSKYVDYDQAYLTGTLSDGAELYYIDSSDKFQSLTLSDADGSGSQLPSIVTYKYDGVTKTANKLTPLTLVVVSEGIDVISGSTTYDSSWKQANVKKGYTVYTLTVKQATAKTAAQLTSVSLYNADTDATVNGTINGDQINFTLPAYFADGHTADWDDAIYFDFAVASGDAYVTFNTVWTTGGTALKPLTFDADGAVADAANVTADNSGATPVLKNSGTAISEVHVKSEDGKNTAKYTVNVEFADAKTGAGLNSVTINKVTARPVGNTVTINLPYGTEITHLTPAFAVSENAFVTYGTPAVVNNNGTAYNFTATQKFVVTSEDGKNTSEYYITVTTDDEFSDVKSSDWFYNDVMTGVAAGVIAGVGNGKFNPTGKVTRAQFAQFIARADGYKADDYMEKTAFSDVKAGTEAAAAIAYCNEKGYISGTGNTKFNPNGNITRQEMAIVICKVKGLNPVTSPKTTFADDSSISSWAKGYVYACYEGGYMAGTGNNKFNPLGTAMRSEAASVIVRNML